jgi:hypothetical protein
VRCPRLGIECSVTRTNGNELPGEGSAADFSALGHGRFLTGRRSGEMNEEHRVAIVRAGTRM